MDSTILTEQEIESSYLGQFIPVHYHHNMLMDANRMMNFKAAIDYTVLPGARVLELGGGTGVLSWFAAPKAKKVWCVEFNPDMVREARRLLSRNPHGQKVEVVQADAFEYLPPEPVDVVICEMIHVAMLREKQVEVIESFKRRYAQRFGGPLPVFIPQAVIMAVQPRQQDYNFQGYDAPIVQFRDPNSCSPQSVKMARPAVYSVLDFNSPVDMNISWEGRFRVERGGTINALRFITKNILAVVKEQSKAIEWTVAYMTAPLANPLTVNPDDVLKVGFQYRTGGSIPSLMSAIRVEVNAAARPAQAQPWPSLNRSGPAASSLTNKFLWGVRPIETGARSGLVSPMRQVGA